MSDQREIASAQLEQIRRVLVFICAWLCGGFTAALCVAVYLASLGKLDWAFVYIPAIAGAGAYLSLIKYEGVRWSNP
jgi:hypothetical protein